MPQSSLVALGWDDHLAALTADFPPDLVVGRVARVDRGQCTVLTATGSVRANTPEPVAVGDWVGVDTDAERVDAIVPRRSALTRRDPHEPDALVLAANIDWVLVVQGLNRGVNARRLERELVVAWESGALPVVVLTKVDLCADPDAAIAEAEALAVGAEVLGVSNETGEGIDRLAELTSGGRTFVLIGASGVGKSTLVNRLAGTEVQLTKDIRETDGRGRHTTTAGQLIMLPTGGILIDTPGVRALALWDGEEGLSRVFADLDELAVQCKFGDCEHQTEPGCAVRGVIDEDRLESWRKLRRELDRTTAERAGWERAEESKKARAFARSIKGIKGRP